MRSIRRCPRGSESAPQYVYVPHKETKPYFDMAHEWVLADRMFQSQLDESFVAHQYIIAAQAGQRRSARRTGAAGRASERRSSRRSPGNANTARPARRVSIIRRSATSSTARTLVALLHQRVRIRPAMAYWSSYQAVKHIYQGTRLEGRCDLAEMKFHHRRAAGKLASFTWITPLCHESDHVNCGGG